VRSSGRVLQALTFQPTAAIVAAPTTSLPERVGGQRNWDYRSTWVRDASLTMEALWVAACPDEAARFFGFLAAAAASPLGRGVDLQVMFGVGGERDLSERELPTWPVGAAAARCGSATTRGASSTSTVSCSAPPTGWPDQLSDLDQAIRSLLVAAADIAGCRWQDKD